MILKTSRRFVSSSSDASAAQVVISTDWCGVSVREADRRDREQNNNVNKISKE